MTNIDFPIGTLVDVEADGDYISENFTGRVHGYHDDYIVVIDQDDHHFDCDRSQLTVVEE